jgi:hypothetical protein
VRAAALSSFRKAFNEDLRLEGYSGWEGKEAFAAFEQALDAHIASVRAQRVSEVGVSKGLLPQPCQLVVVECFSKLIEPCHEDLNCFRLVLLDRQALLVVPCTVIA